MIYSTYVQFTAVINALYLIRTKTTICKHFVSKCFLSYERDTWVVVYFKTICMQDQFGKSIRSVGELAWSIVESYRFAEELEGQSEIHIRQL